MPAPMSVTFFVAQCTFTKKNTCNTQFPIFYHKYTVKKFNETLKFCCVFHVVYTNTSYLTNRNRKSKHNFP